MHILYPTDSQIRKERKISDSDQMVFWITILYNLNFYVFKQITKILITLLYLYIMDTKSREVQISLSRIINWTQYSPNIQFILRFISIQTDSQITEKLIQGNLQGNVMHLNSLLKINYTTQQNQILIQLYWNHPQKQQLLGQFEIDLDLLSQKRVQYLSFGSRDKILQISTVAYEMQENNRTKDQFSQWKTLQKFQANQIRNQTERQSNIQQDKVNHNYRRNKKSFSYKVVNLLNEIKSIRKNCKRQYLPQEKCAKKCLSETQIKSLQNNQIQRVHKSTHHQKQEVKTPKRQKNKLLLQSLDVVPCEDYYENRKVGKRTQQSNSTYHSNQKGDGIKKNFCKSAKIENIKKYYQFQC